MTQPSFHSDESLPSTPAEEGRGYRGRLIRPNRSGATIDGKIQGGKELRELLLQVSSDSRGRLAHLKSLASTLEKRMAQEVSSSREKIEAASEKARVHIENRVRNTTRRCDEILEQGHLEGSRQGYAHGFSEGLEQGILEGRFEGKKLAAEKLESRFSAECGEIPGLLETLFEQLEMRWRSAIENNRSEIVNMVLEVSRRVIRRNIEDLPEVVTENLEIAVARICDRNRISIEVNPADRSAIDTHLPKLARPLKDCEAVRIEENPSMERGGCRVSSDTGGVDLSIETQMDVIEQILLNSGGGNV